jgi:hypothetical protein
MSDLETRLRDALHEETAPLSAPTGLAVDMAVRGARVRRRRRVAAAATCVAAVAVAVPLLKGITTSTSTVGPVSPSPSVRHSPRPNPPATPVRSAKAWLATLADGSPPSVPYLRGMTYVWSPRPGHTASYPIRDVNTNVFGPVDGGVMVSRAEFGIATPGVRFRRLGEGSAFGMAASPDGREVAVADTKVHEVRVYDARTGAPIASTRAPDARVLSWGPGGVYYETGYFSGKQKFWVWSPGSVAGPRRAVTSLDKYGVGIELAVNCTKLVTTDSVSDCLPIPRTATNIAVSHDGRYVGYLAGNRTMWVAVLDTTTGQTRRLTAPLPFSAFNQSPGNLVWESGDRLLFVLSSDRHRHQATDSIVRCSFGDGSCEVAVRGVTGRTGGFYPPLSLTPFFSY